MPKVKDDWKDHNGMWVNGWSTGGERFITKSGILWGSIKQRCRVGSYAQSVRPTYVGCYYSKLFSDFQTFTDWHVKQIGYGEPNYHLDKDLLVQGNKEYSEDKCVLIPVALNSFLTDHAATRGPYPQGVCLYRDKRRFMAYTSYGCKRQHIGLYITIEEAAAAYKVAKEEIARKWYERLKDGEFPVDPRVIERMRTWEFVERNIKLGVTYD